MLATARMPPMCLTKMSLDTLRNREDSLTSLPNTKPSLAIAKQKCVPKVTPRITASKHEPKAFILLDKSEKYVTCG
jgi:hypothetical protein